jgi:hypothetical protein
LFGISASEIMARVMPHMSAVDPARDENGFPNLCLDGTGLRRHVAMFDRHWRYDVDRAGKSHHRAVRDIEVVEFGLLIETPADGQPGGLIQAVGLDFLGGNPHANDPVRSDDISRRLQHFGDNSKPTFFATAERVGAQVGQRVQELRDQHAMAGRQLDAIEPRLHQTACRPCKGSNDEPNIVDRHGSRHAVKPVVGHHGGSERHALETVLSIGDAAAVIDLAEYLGAMKVNGLRNHAVSGNTVAATGIEIVRGRYLVAVGARRFHDNQASAAARSSLVVGHHVLARSAVAGKDGLVGGRENPISDFVAPDFVRREQMFEGQRCLDSLPSLGSPNAFVSMIDIRRP